MIRALILIGPLLLAACRTCPTCPALPARPLTPAPVVTVAAPLPCVLPPLPAPIEIDANPVDQSDPRLVIERSTLGALVVYLAGLRMWVDAAKLCLETR